MRRSLAVALFLLLLLAPPSSFAGIRSPKAEGLPPLPRGEPTFVGAAEVDGTTIYIEQTWSVREGDRLFETHTRYTDPAGQPIARRYLDFRRSQRIPDFRFLDLRDGYLEGSRLAGTNVSLFLRRSWDAPMETRSHAVGETHAIDGGFHGFVLQNWDRLVAGEVLPIRFAVPSRLDFVDFRVKREPDREVPGQGTRAFSMEIESFWIRLFIEPVRVYYLNETRRMQMYEGISNVPDTDGKSQEVLLRYPPGGGH
jgi:hypothetical protein